jgi:retron-type reverse transcriptase
MRRVNHLFERIVDRDNLRVAVHKALGGKRSKRDARAFVANLDDHLESLRSDLVRGDIALGDYRQFTIRDPKERLITAPCFRERVLHHAIINVCEPVFERWLIADTFACRQGKGRIAALSRAREFARRFPFFLKMDIRQYFASISHEILGARLECLFKDERLLDLVGRIIASFESSPGRGLPIGSLTSQHFANFYLGWFDRFVKESLRSRGYVRYMDDLAIWGGSSAELRDRLAATANFLKTELGLELKPSPYRNRVEHGMDFLGCRVFPTHLILNRRSRVRFRRKLGGLEASYLVDRIDELCLQQRASALVAFTRTPGLSSWRFRRSVLDSMPVGDHDTIGREPGDPGRELEQRPAECAVGEPEQEQSGEPEQQPGLPRGPSSTGVVH